MTMKATKNTPNATRGRRLLRGSMLASLAAGAVLAGAASANDSSSTVGEQVCGLPAAVNPCGSATPLNLADWGGMTTGAPGSELAGTYHCNNVLFEGRSGEATGTRPGTAYYTIGRAPDPTADPATDTAAKYDDCDASGSKTLTASSIVLLRGVGYVNSPTLDPNGDFSEPGCAPPVRPDRNPGCPGGSEAGKSAGYVGVGRGNEPVGNVDAGAKGNLP